MNKKYKVVKIIDDTSLIINAGSVDKVQVGDIMVVVGKGDIVIDPDTNEELGCLEIEKARLKIMEVYEKMCICQSAYTSNYFSNMMDVNTIFSYKHEKLDVDPTEITGKGDMIIKIGDIAEHIPQQKKEKEE